MDSLTSTHQDGEGSDRRLGPIILVTPAELIGPPEPVAAPPPRRPVRRWRTPLALFVLTCVSTLWAGEFWSDPARGWAAWMYAVPLMTILVCHEAGHFVQALRYRVFASFPFFIPMPITPIGTMGAVIGMEARVGDRRAVFDIGISGPLAGLVPTLVFCVLGLHWSAVERVSAEGPAFMVPLLFEFLAECIIGTPPSGYQVICHPTAVAGLVGMLITAINLFPIGQLDGGHILYGLLRRRAHTVAWLLLGGATGAILFTAFVLGQYQVLGLLVMVGLLLALGPRHPPTANDCAPLGGWRIALGWATLAFVPLGFTPMLFS
jgi:membrane-associated protease RseP (regulator of RpoE activity)